MALAGCETPEMRAAQAQQDAAECEGTYAAAKGTPQFTQCMLVLSERRMEQRAAFAEAMDELGESMSQASQPSMRCTSNSFGTMTTTNCY